MPALQPTKVPSWLKCRKMHKMAKEIRQEIFTGIRDALPIMLGYIPVGIAYGVMARQAGFSIGETVLMSVMVYAGAAQMMTTGLYAAGTAYITIILSTFILNLRHIIMSSCIMNMDGMRREKKPSKIIASFWITDEVFAVSVSGKESRGIYHFLGLALAAYFTWMTGSFVGAVFSDFLPSIVTDALGIALYGMFIGLLVPGLRKNFKLVLLVILCCLLNWGLCKIIPSSWAMIATTLIGAGIGVFFVDLKEEKTDAL